MRLLLFPAILFSLSALAGDDAFNGRWNIKPVNESRNRAWWLEVTGAGTPNLKGRFVGAPGGDMNDIPEISIASGELKFAFERAFSRGTKSKGVYRAHVDGDKISGTFDVEGAPKSHLDWNGKRAPVLAENHKGKHNLGKPVALFNGKDLTGWKPLVAGQALGWEVKDGAMTNVKGANNLVSDRTFWNFNLHAEFRVGKDSNSGIGLRGRYEVQILEDYGKEPNSHSNGALYSRIKPAMNASKPAGEWQTYDITLIGREVTIVLNGKTTVDRKEIEGLTAMASDPDESAPGPIVIQGDHGPVEFRKLIVTPLTVPGSRPK
jgi:Domain of Unknown Function (DUF1080)